MEWLLASSDELGPAAMIVRALIVYLAALTMVRWGEKRFMGKSTAFDVILGVMLGSVLSRAITGQAPLLPTLAAGLALVLLHWLFASIAYRFSAFGTLVKGQTRVLVSDGKVDWDEMRKAHLSENDLKAALRLKAGTEDWAEVREARLERSGEISVIKKS